MDDLLKDAKQSFVESLPKLITSAAYTVLIAIPFVCSYAAYLAFTLKEECLQMVRDLNNAGNNLAMKYNQVVSENDQLKKSHCELISKYNQVVSESDQAVKDYAVLNPALQEYCSKFSNPENVTENQNIAAAGDLNEAPEGNLLT